MRDDAVNELNLAGPAAVRAFAHGVLATVRRVAMISHVPAQGTVHPWMS